RSPAPRRVSIRTSADDDASSRTETASQAAVSGAGGRVTWVGRWGEASGTDRDGATRARCVQRRGGHGLGPAARADPPPAARGAGCFTVLIDGRARPCGGVPARVSARG